MCVCVCVCVCIDVFIGYNIRSTFYSYVFIHSTVCLNFKCILHNDNPLCVCVCVCVCVPVCVCDSLCYNNKCSSGRGQECGMTNDPCCIPSGTSIHNRLCYNTSTYTVHTLRGSVLLLFLSLSLSLCGL